MEPIRVLFVEDEVSEMELAVHELQANDIVHVARRVATEETLRAALNDFKPTIILSDYALPGFSGPRALEIARECAPAVPFVFLSGTIGEDRAIEALRQGAVDYVLKTNLARLGPVVRRAIAEASARSVARRQEREIARLTGVLRMLSGINSAVVRIRDRVELLAEACRLAVSVGGYAAAVVALQKTAAQGIEATVWEGIDREAAVKLCERIRERAVREVKAGRISPQAPSVIVLHESEYLGKQSGSEDRPLVALPLVVDKTLIGLLAVCMATRGRVGDEEMRMLREVAANLSFALQYLQQDSRVRLLSYFDVLTGLAKRTLFCQRLGRLLQAPEAAGSHHAVAILDIASLSAVNDSFGRHAGDLLLQLLADRLKRRFKNTEWLAHFSGGTFAVVRSSAGKSERCGDALITAVDTLFAEPFALEGKEVPVAARAGIALFPEDGRDPEALVQKAEAALRAAKVSGEWRGHYSAERHSASLARSALERKLRVALERKQFELHYQPKVDVKTRRIEGVEALIRWNDPESGLVSPAAFLPILESSGLIVPVGEWVIERAAADCREWLAAGLPPVRVAVNVCPAQLRDVNLVPCVLQHTRGWATPSAGLDMEITEGALLEEFSADMQKLQMLRKDGLRVAIDDFGTGYSSLGRLEQLPVDMLKIDRSFVRGIRSGARGKRLVAIIISIARAFGMSVVAEGVEEQVELDALWELGCDQSQGFLHSKAVSQDGFAQLLAHGNGRFILPKEPTEAARRDSLARR